MNQDEKKFEKMLTVADVCEYLSVTNKTSIAGLNTQDYLFIVSVNAKCSISPSFMYG